MAGKNPFDRKQWEYLLSRDHTLYGGVLWGMEGRRVELRARATEVRTTSADVMSCVSITGMARGVIYESRTRIDAAFKKLGIGQCNVSILIDLAPADLPKDGTWLDLPMAVIALQAAGILPDLKEVSEEKYLLLGEVGIHGDVRRVPGVLSLVRMTKPGQAVILPAGNEREASLMAAAPGHEGTVISPVSTLAQVIDFFQGIKNLPNALAQKMQYDPIIDKAPDIGRVKGQKRAKEAALIAAAGGHNILLIGPPGEGKTLLANAISGILPRLSRKDVVDITTIYSACGELKEDGQVVHRRPFRSIHHSISKQGLVGGGSAPPVPGEITRAHLGVLFLDEFPEFSSSTLEALRQPIEDGVVRIARVGASVEYPCRFTLVAAMNPCPCGYFGDDRCRCNEKEVKRYQSRISGPILDRIDLKVEMESLSTEERFSEIDRDLTNDFRALVETARQRQDKRFGDGTIPFNAAIPGGRVLDYCLLSEAANGHYRELVDQNRITTRSMDRLARVSRTVADIYNSDTVEPIHLDIAASFVLPGALKILF